MVSKSKMNVDKAKVGEKLFFKKSPLSLNMEHVHQMWKNIHMRISKVHMAKFERLMKQQP
jgi:hypothetical protein